MGLMESHTDYLPEYLEIEKEEEPYFPSVFIILARVGKDLIPLTKDESEAIQEFPSKMAAIDGIIHSKLHSFKWRIVEVSHI